METDHRPWGYYTVLSDEPDHKVKRICVYPGKRLSLQRHRRRGEHWYLVRGEAVATLEDREIALRPGDAIGHLFLERRILYHSGFKYPHTPRNRRRKNGADSRHQTSD